MAKTIVTTGIQGDTGMDKVKNSKAKELFAKKNQRKAQRKKLFFIAFLALAFLAMLSFTADAYRLKMLAENKLKISEVENDSLRKEADLFRNDRVFQKEKVVLAERNAQLARLSHEIAERELAAAIRAKNEAFQLVNQDNNAFNKKQLRVAEEALRNAKKNADITNKNLVNAIEAKAIVEAEKEIVSQEKEMAIQNEKMAKENNFRLLMDNLAAKSLELDQQKALKGLLALEAYNINNRLLENDVSSVNKSLHQAIEGLSDNNFNVISHMHKGAIRSIAKVDNDVIYSTGSDGQLLKSQMNDWSKIGAPKTTTETILAERISNTDVAISPNGEFIAFASKKPSIQIIDTKSNQAIANISYSKQGFIQNIAFSSDNQTLLSIGSDRSVWQYDLNKKLSKKILTLNQNAKTMSVHPNTNQMALGYASGLIEIYNLADLAQPNSMIQLNERITVLDFEPLTDMLVAGDAKGQIHFFNSVNNQYDLTSYEMKMTHSQQISEIAFSGNEVAVGSFDGSVSVWSLNKWNDKLYEPMVLENTKWVMSLTYSANQNQWIIGYADGSLKFWTSDSRTLANHLCELIQQNSNRNTLTDDEFKKYFGDAIERKDYIEYCLSSSLSPTRHADEE